MASAYDILQEVRNELDTAQTGWLAFADAATVEYDAAYSLHTGALAAAKNKKQLQIEARWKLIGIMVSAFTAPWVGRFFAQVDAAAQSIDSLTASIAADSLKGLTTETQNYVQGTAFDKLKQPGKSTRDPYEPVADNSVTYSSRLKEGIERRALKLKAAMDKVLKAQLTQPWPEAIAKNFSEAVVANCPFITDVPDDTSDEFRKDFRDQSELAMWVAWAIQQDVNWWRKADIEDIDAMTPVSTRLVIVGVPWLQISDEFIGDGVFTVPRRIRILNMVKFIEWAKTAPKPRRAVESGPQAVCKKVDPLLLRLKQGSVSNPNTYWRGGDN